MDRARQKTDSLLAETERRVNGVYRTDPSLLRIRKKYEKYMDGVKKATADLYNAYVHSSDEDDKRKAKDAYIKEVKRLTVDSKKYRDIVDEFTDAMATANQRALDIANGEMPEVYAISYNQLAIECKKAGIRVDG